MGEREIEKTRERWWETKRDRHVNMQVVRKQIGRHTERQTDIKIDTSRDRLIDRQTEIKSETEKG